LGAARRRHIISRVLVKATPLPPIFTARLFAKLDGMLAELLRSLQPEDWERQTVSPKWKVKDVAAHLLDTQLRKLSLSRDGYLPEASPAQTQAELAAFINRLNEEGVAYFLRMSPPVLISMMEVASRQAWEFYESLDPFAPAMFPVSWAGEEQSSNWFDTAREFTERWHHQQQIRLAVNRPGIMTRELCHPVLDCFLRALPFHYRTMARKPGSLARFEITGDCGGSWFLLREDDAWKLTAAFEGEILSETTIPHEIAWRIFTKGIEHGAAKAACKFAGDAEIAQHILGMVSIIG